MHDITFPYFEALTMLRDWSVMLQTIQAALLITLIIVGVFADLKEIMVRKWLLISIVMVTISISVGLNVIGTIPWSLQNLTELATKYKDIYQFPNYINIPIWVIAFCQHLFGILGLISIVIFICSFLRRGESQTKQ